jgi:NAD(P)-dependent dehydrogenase (short-subunit alcohol dehydrogenase family)
MTGCSSGLGRQVAEKMASLGDRVYAIMRRPSGGHERAGNNTGLLDAAGLPALATLRTVEPAQARPAIARL